MKAAIGVFAERYAPNYLHFEGDPAQEAAALPDRDRSNSL